MYAVLAAPGCVVCMLLLSAVAVMDTFWKQFLALQRMRAPSPTSAGAVDDAASAQVIDQLWSTKLLRWLRSMRDRCSSHADLHSYSLSRHRQPLFVVILLNSSVVLDASFCPACMSCMHAYTCWSFTGSAPGHSTWPAAPGHPAS